MLKAPMIIAASLAFLGTPLLAQSSGHHGMGGMKQGMMQHGMMMKNTPANPYAEAEMRMNHKMMAAVGADASETWVRKMIEHHRGAIEMSKILLAKGSDAEAKAQAQKATAEQERGIAELQGWLKRHGKRPQ
jgi:uncharacterized protein (DUF305 family)